MTPQQRIVAAVDFGTHGTGFAWAIKDAPQPQVFYFEDWRGQPVFYPKNLSALLLDERGEVVEWGYAARELADDLPHKNDHPYYEHFKMALQSDQRSITDTSGGVAQAFTLTMLYLRQIYRFALEHITARAKVSADEISWRLTVPAIWDYRERALMREAAERAGFPPGLRLRLALEPEAAAHHCWANPAFTGLATLGNRFVVVDAGSGTVDITSYRVVGSVQDPVLDELVKPLGGRLGASFVDEQFITRIIPERLGQQTAREVTADSKARRELLDNWEKAKRDFDPERKSPLNITLPRDILRKLFTTHEQTRARLADRQAGVDDAIVLHTTEAQQLFDHAINPMVSLVDKCLQQIGATGSEYILLVGGFSESHYLQSRFRSHFADRVDRVLVAPQPAYAVLLGAVKSGLKELINSRIARFTYGIASDMAFDEKCDPLSRRYEAGYGDLLCRDRFSIFVRVDESVNIGRTESKDFYPTSPSDSAMYLRLFRTADANPRYVYSSAVEVGVLQVDVSSTVGRPQAERYVRVTMSFGTTEIGVRAVDTHSGQEFSTSIEFVTDVE